MANRANMAYCDTFPVHCQQRDRCSNPMGVDYQELMCNQISVAKARTRKHTHTHTQSGGQKNTRVLIGMTRLLCSHTRALFIFC